MYIQSIMLGDLKVNPSGNEKKPSDMDFHIWGSNITLPIKAVMLFILAVLILIFFDFYYNVKPHQYSWKEDETRLQNIENEVDNLKTELLRIKVMSILDNKETNATNKRKK